MTTPAERAYPIRPVPEDDPRFTTGLIAAMARVLEEHGYPPITTGADIVALRQTLYRFLYVGTDTPGGDGR